MGPVVLLLHNHPEHPVTGTGKEKSREGKEQRRIEQRRKRAEKERAEKEETGKRLEREVRRVLR